MRFETYQRWAELAEWPDDPVLIAGAGQDDHGANPCPVHFSYHENCHWCRAAYGEPVTPC